MKYFYSASVMGFGKGRFWHRFYNFPDFPRVTKTITTKRKLGKPFAVVKFGRTIWNSVGLHNPGFEWWMKKYEDYEDLSNIIVSIAGYDSEIEKMVNTLERLPIAGIELNFSCPNHKSFNNLSIPYTDKPIYLKLRYNQDPYKFDLNRVEGIRMNSVPTLYGSFSGFFAQEKNWRKIYDWNKEGLNIAGCSITCENDIRFLKEYCGCKEIGIGSVTLTNRRLVENLNNE